MRVEKIENICLTVEEHNILTTLESQLNNLRDDLEDYEQEEIVRNLCIALDDFLNICDKNLDVDY